MEKAIKALALFFVVAITALWSCAFFIPLLTLLAVSAFLAGPIGLGIWISGLILGEDWNVFNISHKSIKEQKRKLE